MLAACDKLHKLYSTTSEPVVWARSIGVEVLNELDSVKGALMMLVGSDVGRRPSPQVGWDLAAKGVETFARNVNDARALGSTVAGAVGAAVRQLWQSQSGPRAS